MPRREHAAVEDLVGPRRRHQRDEALRELLGRQLQRRRPVRPRPLQLQPDPVARQHLDPPLRERGTGDVPRQPTQPRPVARADHDASVQAVAVARGAQRRQLERPAPELLHALGLALASEGGAASDRRGLQQGQGVVRVAVAVAVAVAGDLPEREKRLKERNLETLREFSTRKPDEKPKHVHFEFYAAPVEILGGERVEKLKVERTRVEGGRNVGTGEFFEIPCGLVIAAIGYRAEPVDGAPFDEKQAVIPNADGRVEKGLYAAGWIKRGPTGVISSNRPDGEEVARHIRQDFADGAKEPKPGRPSLVKLLNERKVRVVSFDDWKKLEAAEAANAGGKRPRKKFVAVKDMLDHLDRH